MRRAASRGALVLRAGEAAYRVLLRAYPRTFRERFAGEMALAFRDAARAALGAGGAARLLVVWFRFLLDLLVTAPRERFAAVRRRARARSGPGNGRRPPVRHGPVPPAGAGAGAGGAGRALAAGGGAVGAGRAAGGGAVRDGRGLAAARGAVPCHEHGQEPCAEARSATPGYFEAMGIPVLRGRGITAQDRDAAVPVVVINETMARRYWPDQDPLGRRFKWGGHQADAPWRAVVGVVGDVKHFGLDGEVRPEVYVPHAQRTSAGMTVVLRASGAAVRLARAARAEVSGLDPDLPIIQSRTMAEFVSRSVAGPRFRAVLLGSFAAIALLLSLVGLYGVLAYSVAQRTAEIGVRLALGAARSDLLRMVVREGLLLAGLGLLVGLPAALLASRAVAGLLFGIEPADPLTFLALSVLLVAMALLASWLPARRAARVDPMTALRED